MKYAEEPLILLRLACHANLLALSEKERGVQMIDGYGLTLLESSGESDRNGLSAKTRQESSRLTGAIDSLRSSKGFPKQGMLSGGKPYQPQPLARVIGGKGSGLLPTPAARDWKDTPGMSKSKGTRSRTDQLHRKLFFLLETPPSGGKINHQYRLWLMGFPVHHFGNRQS